MRSLGVLQEARLFHSFVRAAESWTEFKGQNPLTEHYSALGPEVVRTHDGRPHGGRNPQLIEALLSSDVLVVAGQASSHCVKATVEARSGQYPGPGSPPRGPGLPARRLHVAGGGPGWVGGLSG